MEKNYITFGMLERKIHNELWLISDSVNGEPVKFAADFSKTEIDVNIGDVKIEIRPIESRFCVIVSAGITYDKELALLENFEALIPAKTREVIDHIKAITEEVNQR